ncbi:MAG TPA: hypothetical protein VFE08_08570, partial [Candidatus Sulfotelmatobacter sp.]|nr:hypothetical protein [Candidatus Sulfotelmatobacter sp.]
LNQLLAPNKSIFLRNRRNWIPPHRISSISKDATVHRENIGHSATKPKAHMAMNLTILLHHWQIGEVGFGMNMAPQTAQAINCRIIL